MANLKPKHASSLLPDPAEVGRGAGGSSCLPETKIHRRKLEQIVPLKRPAVLADSQPAK